MLFKICNHFWLKKKNKSHKQTNQKKTCQLENIQNMWFFFFISERELMQNFILLVRIEIKLF